MKTSRYVGLLFIIVFIGNIILALKGKDILSLESLILTCTYFICVSIEKGKL